MAGDRLEPSSRGIMFQLASPKQNTVSASSIEHTAYMECVPPVPLLKKSIRLFGRGL
jgi:hypothetical protein